MTENTSRKLAAIMFADIVSYSRLMGSNEGEALKLLKDFERISTKIVNEYEGVIIKKNGDQVFCEFASAKNAVDGSLKLQKELSKYNDSRPKDFKLEVRIGIHIGDVVKREDGDIHGDGVNVAARIQPLASPGGICVSGAVSDALSSHPDYDVISKGEQELKNILQKHSIFQVKTGYETIEPQNYADSDIEIKYFKYIIGIVSIIAAIIFGYNYNWWLGSDQIKIQEKPKRILISEIISNDKNMDILNKSIFNQNKPPDKLEILTEEEKNSIYDELISSLNMKNKNELLSYYTKYDLSKYYAEKGEAAPKFNYDYIKGFQTLDFQSENAIQDMMNLNKKYLGKKESMDRYMTNVQAELAYFPIIYKTLDEYAIYHLVAKQITISEGDTNTSVSFNILVDYKIVTKKDIISTIVNFMDEKIYYFTAINRGTIEIVDDDKIIIKFEKDLKNRIKPRMIYKTQRLYSFDSKIDDIDDVINTKIDDILDYEYYVELDTTSTYYKDYHSTIEYGNSFKLVYTKQELNDLLNRTHRLFKMGEMEDIKGATGGSLGIDIKVVDVFDSTATAIYYKHADKNLRLRKGDIFLY